MSSNRPPQLHLALPAGATSFKRTFAQFGFDVESPVSTAEQGSGSTSGVVGADNGNERNKRPRSDSRMSGLAESSSSNGSQTSDSESSTEGTLTSDSDGEAPLIPAEPPRLPTPELEDVEMPYYTPTSEVSSQPSAPQPRENEQYRAILERFNAFDSEINVLRVGVPPEISSPRSPSPPPTLPPLELPLENAAPPPTLGFMPSITPPLPWRPLQSTERQVPESHTFQQRLDQALDALRSASPLDLAASYPRSREDTRQSTDVPSRDGLRRPSREPHEDELDQYASGRSRIYNRGGPERPPRISTEVDQLSPFRLEFNDDQPSTQRRNSRGHSPATFISRWGSATPSPPVDFVFDSVAQTTPSSSSSRDFRPFPSTNRLSYRRPPLPSSSTSLVSENAAAMRRDMARAEMLNGINSMNTPSETSNDLSASRFLAFDDVPYRRNSRRVVPPDSPSEYRHFLTFLPTLDFARDPERPLIPNPSQSTARSEHPSTRVEDGVRRRAAEAEDPLRIIHNSSLELPLDDRSPMFELLELADESPSREPPSLPSPDLGPVLTPIEMDDNDPSVSMFDIRRPPSPGPGPPHTFPSLNRPGASTLSPRSQAGPTNGHGSGPSTFVSRDEVRNDHYDSAPPNQHPRRPPVFRDINPEDYRPGLYRGTIEQIVQMDQARNGPTQSSPPSLPPLGFEWDWERDQPRTTSSNPARVATHEPAESNIPERRSQRHRLDRDDSYLWHFPGLNPSRGESSDVPRWQSRWRPHGPPPPSAIRDPPGRPEVPSSPFTRPQFQHARSNSDVHQYLSQRPRIEGSRLVIPEPVPTSETSRPSPRSRGAEESFSYAMEVLRRDGLSTARSQQFINHFHERERSMTHPEPSSASSTHDTFGAIPHTGERLAAARRRYHTARRDIFASSDVGQPPSGDVHPSASNPRTAISNRDPPPSNRLRNLRSRLMPTSAGSMFGTPSYFHERSRYLGRSRPMGDYIRDEDFSPSYEFLLQLGDSLGDVKPRSTPEHVIAGLPTGFYKDWATSDSDHRCPICLDDYKSLDPVLKLPECNHWLHKECLEQWLRSANTCPVCRNKVKTSKPTPPGCRPGHLHTSSDSRAAEASSSSSRMERSSPPPTALMNPSYSFPPRSAWTTVIPEETRTPASEIPRRPIIQITTHATSRSTSHSASQTHTHSHSHSHIHTHTHNVSGPREPLWNVHRRPILSPFGSPYPHDDANSQNSEAGPAFTSPRHFETTTTLSEHGPTPPVSSRRPYTSTTTAASTGAWMAYASRLVGGGGAAAEVRNEFGPSVEENLDDIMQSRSGYAHPRGPRSRAGNDNATRANNANANHNTHTSSSSSNSNSGAPGPWNPNHLYWG